MCIRDSVYTPGKKDPFSTIEEDENNVNNTNIDNNSQNNVNDNNSNEMCIRDSYYCY